MLSLFYMKVIKRGKMAAKDLCKSCFLKSKAVVRLYRQISYQMCPLLLHLPVNGKIQVLLESINLKIR